MLIFFGKKILRLIVVILAVTALTFLMINLLPGDAAINHAGIGATLEDVEQIREDLGLNKNIFIRYTLWLIDAVQGRLGHSILTDEPVLEAISHRLPITIELMIISQMLALLLAVPFGIVSGFKSGTSIDKIINTLAFSVMSVPTFVMALLLIFAFSLKLSWFPATGYIDFSDGFWLNVKSFLLPGFSIALVEWGYLMRILRSDMIATLQEDYILMAKSKGLPTVYILFKHALIPSCFTLITILGIQVGHLIGGAVIVESIFALPGIGSLLIASIYGRDYPMVQGCILYITIAYVMINFFVDILYTFLDPRIRSQNISGVSNG
ncbi:ABC transporter permease [Desulfobacterales bacterium HSG17]|nr:ABC transporter permease [Desulfobacterales bacterium HSG17]